MYIQCTWLISSVSVINSWPCCLGWRICSSTVVCIKAHRCKHGIEMIFGTHLKIVPNTAYFNVNNLSSHCHTVLAHELIVFPLNFGRELHNGVGVLQLLCFSFHLLFQSLPQLQTFDLALTQTFAYLVCFPSKKSLNFLVLVIFSGKTNQKKIKV